MSNKKIIHIYGASGSGTSTLGKKICDELGYTFMDTDYYFWVPTDPMFTTKRSVPERVEMMKKDIENASNVVISGSLVDWGDELIPLFTLAVRIVTDTNIRIERLHIREYERFGLRIRKGGDIFEEHKRFIDWASQYDAGSIDMRSKAKHDDWEQLLQCPKILVDGSKDINEIFEIVKKVI